jgi:hypothetical protein
MTTQNPSTSDALQIEFPPPVKTGGEIPVLPVPRVAFDLPGADTGSNTAYGATFQVCHSPRCGCTLVRADCAQLTPDGAAIPQSQRGFWVDVRERSLDMTAELKADPETLRLANHLLPRVSDASWQQLHDWFWAAKIEAIERADLADADINDLPDASDGLMVPFVEVFPLGLSLYFEFENALWGGDESYCVQQDCSCTQIVLLFPKFKDADGTVATSLGNLPALRYDYRSHATELLNPGPPGTPLTRELLAALKQAHPSLDIRLKLHHHMLQLLYARRRMADALLVNKQLSESLAIGPQKAGRNDPCPCGSGKKFKKCCGG